jgi:hypothetical protein
MSACLAGGAVGAEAPPLREEYRYEARPLARPNEGEPKRIALGIERRSDATALTLVTRSPEGTEEIRMAVDPPYAVRVATRRAERGGVTVQDDEVRRDGERVQMESRRGGRTTRKTVTLPDLPFAVDASLLLLGRSFVESDLTEQRVFMADFSRRTITILLRKRGTEEVTVPAGRFPCHRLEVVVRFLIFRAVITYWISVDPPHFLVKHVGRRGPFSATTMTQLVERSVSWPRVPEPASSSSTPIPAGRASARH